MWPSHVLIEVTRVIKLRFLNFSSAFEVTNNICLKILSDLSQFGNSTHVANTLSDRKPTQSQ